MKHSTTLNFFFCAAFFACNNSSSVGSTQEDTHHKKESSTTTRVDKEISATWSSFVNIVETKDFNNFKNISLDSIRACDSVYDIQRFIQKCFPKIFDKTLLSRLSGTTRTEIIDKTIDLASFSSTFFKQLEIKGNEIKIKEILITKIDSGPDIPEMIAIDFLKTKKGYKFFSCDSFGGPICCR